MKKLLLFFIAVFAITALSGKELDAYAETFGAAEYASYENESGEVLGQTITLSNCTLDEKEILYKLGAVYHFSTGVGDIKIIYGYTPKLKRITVVDNKPVNFQLTFSGGTVTISNPVNFGSF